MGVVLGLIDQKSMKQLRTVDIALVLQSKGFLALLMLRHGGNLDAADSRLGEWVRWNCCLTAKTVVA